MRLTAALLTLCACSSESILTPPSDAGRDATPDVAVVEDAGVEASTCPGAKPATSCIFEDVACGDGGIQYACSGGLCPPGDTGSCFLVRGDQSAAVLCCERRACVRMYAVACNLPDPDAAVPMTQWLCPVGEKPPGKCSQRGAFPAGATAVEYCCQ